MASDTFNMTKYRMTQNSAILGRIKNLTDIHQDLTMGDAHVQYEFNPSIHIQVMVVDTNKYMK